MASDIIKCQHPKPHSPMFDHLQHLKCMWLEACFGECNYAWIFCSVQLSWWCDCFLHIPLSAVGIWHHLLGGIQYILGRFPTPLWIHGACLDFWKKDIGLRSQPMLHATQKCEIPLYATIKLLPWLSWSCILVVLCRSFINWHMNLLSGQVGG